MKEAKNIKNRTQLEKYLKTQYGKQYPSNYYYKDGNNRIYCTKGRNEREIAKWEYETNTIYIKNN